MYIYESEGLVNNSLTAFCTPKQSTSGTKCVSVTSQVEIGDTILINQNGTECVTEYPRDEPIIKR